MKRLGILGGGQLGRMLVLEGRRFDLELRTLDPDPEAPCAVVADHHVAADFADVEAVKEFAALCDVVTFEFENIPQSTIAALEEAGCCVMPSSKVLKITQDRLLEKDFVRSCGLQTAPYVALNDASDIDSVLAAVKMPAILKTRHGGYDGKGQWRIHSREDLQAAFDEAQQLYAHSAQSYILEGMVQFEREISILVARGHDGTMVTFPVAENEHQHGILARTLVPAAVSSHVAAQAIDIARSLASNLGFIGVLAVEMFVCGEQVLINEMAPRVHNSGHYTLEATQPNQFEMHIRAVLGLPLSEPRLLTPAVMVNILGAGTGNTLAGLDAALREPEVALHLYGKHEAADRRKMGHFTVVASTRADAAATAKNVASMLSWAH